jgi:cytochrome c-type biogenesis protein
MEFLQNLVANTDIPIISAFLLGLLMAISPCPLATNISAIGFISKDIQDRRRVFINGIIYTLGRAISYTVLGIILIAILKKGASTYHLERFMSIYGEKLIGPVLILIGIFMLDIIKLNFSLTGGLTQRMEKKAEKRSYLSALLLGVVFALAFCPYSGVIYFGMLIPMSVSSSAGFALPFVFAIATGLPVLLFAFFIAFSVGKMGSVYNKIKTFEFWFRKIVAVLFILVGLYFIYTVYL